MNTTPNRDETPIEEEARPTAFVLGELDETEAAAFARRVEQDDSLRRDVEAIRRTVAVVDADLRRETAPGLTPEQRAAIERGPASASPPRSILYSFATMRNLWAGVGLAAAACLAVVLWPSVSIGPEDATVAFEAQPGLRGSAPTERLGRDLAAAAPAAPVDETRADASIAGEVSDAPRPEGGGITIRVEEMLSPDEKAAGLEDALAADELDAPRGAAVETKKEQDVAAAGRREIAGRLGPTAEPAPARVAAKQAPPGSGGGLARSAAPPAESSDDAIAGKLAEGETRAAGAAAADQAAGENERDERFGEPAFRRVRQQPRSTFPLDVPTESYDEIRSALWDGQLPAQAVVRIEEMLNSFHYDYVPVTGEHAIAIDVEAGGCPWNEKHRLVRIGLRGRDAAEDDERATIAEAVDVAVEFNLQRVESYRLIGYTNPEMTAFANEHGAAAAIPAGQRVTALYEFVPRDAADGDADARMLSIRLRYQEPADGSSVVLERDVVQANVPLADASDDYRFAAAVAWFGLALREGVQNGGDTFNAVLALAQPAPSREGGFDVDIGGASADRDEFRDLVVRAKRINSRLLREAALREAAEEAADQDR